MKKILSLLLAAIGILLFHFTEAQCTFGGHGGSSGGVAQPLGSGGRQDWTKPPEKTIGDIIQDKAIDTVYTGKVESLPDGELKDKLSGKTEAEKDAAKAAFEAKKAANKAKKDAEAAANAKSAAPSQPPDTSYLQELIAANQRSIAQLEQVIGSLGQVPQKSQESLGQISWRYARIEELRNENSRMQIEINRAMREWQQQQ